MSEAIRITEADELFHYGILRKSGRYPWGSGENPHQRNQLFLQYVDELKREGLTEKQIAEGVGMTTTQLRNSRAISKAAIKRENISMAQKLKDKGYSQTAIGRAMGLNESSVRLLLDPATKTKNTILETTSQMLRDELKDGKYLDIGAGTERHMGISSSALKVAVAALEEEGYGVQYHKVEQLGTGNFTRMKALVPPNTPWRPENQELIMPYSGAYSEDRGRTATAVEPPKPVSSSRVAVRYGPDGGADKDGVIELRRGVPDLSLGKSNYAQVRISVDGTHYLKGMAVYSDDIPDGVDMVFNTNKTNKGDKLLAMKPVKDDPENPFGTITKQKRYIDANDKVQLSPLNIVNEEGNWYDWSSKLSSQFLSKQRPQLARQQLDKSFALKEAEFKEINELTNPAVKKKLLESFSDDADASAVHLKAAGLPRTKSHVILPMPNMKEGEVYAPQYRDGEKVVLVRHPHGGIFELPELTVNNRSRTAKKILGQAKDAIGIHPKVAQQLSGADFDGDTVLVIPNNNGGPTAVKTSKPLESLKDFDPQRDYPGYDGMRKMTPRETQLQMGKISNLITDMTVMGASSDEHGGSVSEIARAVKHSMVVIDAEKHGLDWKRSEKEQGIAELKRKYQAKPDSARSGGASTVISRASSEESVPERKDWSIRGKDAVDPKTGNKVFTPTDASYINKKGEVITKRDRSTKMAETKDAYTLSSGTVMESVYADHANRLKDLANRARKEYISTPSLAYSPSARKTYAEQVKTLGAKLNTALQNKPLERRAQVLANATVKAKAQANPAMEAPELKKVKGHALEVARERTGAKKQQIEITPIEWEAIQSGAISTNRLNDILNNTDVKLIKEYATPRPSTGISAGQLGRAKAMLAAGYTQADVADALGISTTTLNKALD